MNREEYIQKVFSSSGIVPPKVKDVDDAAVRLHRRFIGVLRAKGGTANRSTVLNGGPLRAKDVDAIAALLEGEGLLKIEKVQTKGRPRTVYTLVQP